MSEVLRKHPQTTMTWVCNATDHTSGLSLFDPDVQDRVRMIGWGSQTELIEILDRHGVFVFPTLAEGFAKAPLEAMSRGLIVIASDCCGMRDYMSDHTSQLCEVGNVQQFSERVGRALSGVSIPTALGPSKQLDNTRGRRLLRKFWSSSVSASKLLDHNRCFSSGAKQDFEL